MKRKLKKFYGALLHKEFLFEIKNVGIRHRIVAYNKACRGNSGKFPLLDEAWLMAENLRKEGFKHTIVNQSIHDLDPNCSH